MRYLLNKSMENIASLRHFYDVQKKYIDKKAKQGMKENRMGFLTDFYFNVTVHGTEKEKKRSTFLNLKKLIERHITIQEITEKSVIYTVNDENARPFINVANAAKEYQKYAEMPIMHGNNTLIMLITRFEEFISDFIKIIYQKYPQKYLDNQTITFSEISQNDVEKIRTKIIDREIDGIMRESYTNWFKLFEEHKMCFKCCEREYEILKELYARRNILVHNSGEVNDSYIKNVPQTQYACGDVLYADEKYLDKAFEAIKTIIFCILIEGVRLQKENKDEYIDDIFEVAFNELIAENYKTCETVFYSLHMSPFVDEKTRYLAQVNYWISKIEISGFDSVKAEIEKLDVSALAESFSLAKCVLLRKYEEATECIENLYYKKELPFYVLEEWPLFKEYRKSAEYNKFKMSHPELSGAVALETKSENPMDNKVATQTVKTELKDNIDEQPKE